MPEDYSVQVLKLTSIMHFSGLPTDNIIAEVHYKNDLYFVRNPMGIVINPDKGTYVLIPGFMLPLAKLASGNENLVLKAEHVFCSGPANDQATKLYHEQMSPILTPKKPSLIL